MNIMASWPPRRHNICCCKYREEKHTGLRGFYQLYKKIILSLCGQNVHNAPRDVKDSEMGTGN